MPFIVGDLPPTPTPSFHSPSRRVSASNFHNFGALPVGTDKMRNDAQPVTGPSSGFRPIPRAVPERDLPPTPPVNDVESSVNLSNNASDSTPMSSGLSFVEPSVPQRKRRGRRPPSVYPSPGEEPMYQTQRKYTDPTPRTHRYTEDEAEEPTDSQQLDVDLDAYSTTGFEEEDGLEDREPTLSFVTTSTVESVTSTPSMGKSYGFQTETVGGKPELGPRIRMRTTAGRSNAYSSAESSMASGASSYHAYPENHVYYPHPPPLPVVPNAYALAAEQVGLGITGHHLIISSRRSDPQLSSPNSHPPLSPSTSFVHRPWRRDVVNRLRSDSAASSVTIASVSTSDTAPSASGISASDRAVPYPYDSYQYSDRLPWEQDDSPVERQSEAIAMVDEGRGKILEIEKLNDMGGLESLTEESIGSLTGSSPL